jgi:hypothetical protein
MDYLRSIFIPAVQIVPTAQAVQGRVLPLREDLSEMNDSPANSA